MVAAERLPVLPSPCAAGAFAVGAAFTAGAGAEPLKIAESSALSAAICSEIAMPRWSCERVGVVFIDWRGSGPAENGKIHYQLQQAHRFGIFAARLLETKESGA